MSCAKTDRVTQISQGRLLLYVVQDGIRQTFLFGPGEEIVIPFDSGLLPNYVLTGAYFDGERVFPIKDISVKFSPAQRELAVAVQPNKEQYQPGETMDVTLTVTDSATGLPAAGASVLLSVADEASFSGNVPFVSVLAGLYPYVYPEADHHHWYASFNQFLPAKPDVQHFPNSYFPTFQQGFSDHTAFLTAQTDEEGNAILSVPLPEDEVVWRLTTIVVSQDHHAGEGVAHVISANN